MTSSNSVEGWAVVESWYPRWAIYPGEISVIRREISESETGRVTSDRDSTLEKVESSSESARHGRRTDEFLLNIGPTKRNEANGVLFFILFERGLQREFLERKLNRRNIESNGERDLRKKEKEIWNSGPRENLEALMVVVRGEAVEDRTIDLGKSSQENESHSARWL